MGVERIGQVKTQSEIVFHNSVKAGFPVSPEGYNLGIADNDRKAWAELVVMLNEGISLGVVDANTEVTIKDISGNPHTITAGRLKQVIFELGMYYKTLWDAL